MPLQDALASGSYYFSIAAMIFMVLFLILTYVNNEFHTQTRKLMLHTAILSLIGCMAELLAVSMGQNPAVPIFLKKILYSLNLSTMMLCAMSFTRYTYSYILPEAAGPKGRTYILISRSILVVFHILLLINFFYPFVFDCSQTEVVPKPLLELMAYGVPLLYLALGLIGIFRFRKKLSRREFYALLTAHAIVVLGAVLQGLTADRILFVCFSIAIGLYIVNFFLEAPDYHRLIETNKKLADAEQRANAANEAKSAFLSAMSHEIRTPMNAVIGLNEMTRMVLADEKLASGDKIRQASDYADSIHSAGESLLYVINDILDMSKIESGKMDIVNEPYHVRELLAEMSDTFYYQADNKGLRFSLQADEQLPGYVEGDRLRVRQVITNIVNNAIKYTAEGSVEVRVDGQVTGDTVRYDISVSDTGIGIREENLPHLFDTFERFDERRNHYIEGSGLGLSIVKKLLLLMNGSVEVQSTYGKGSTFTVHLPQKICSEETIGSYRKHPDAPAKEKAFSAQGRRVLVVDDNGMNLQVTKNFLQRMKAEVTLAHSGAEALQMLSEEAYDLVLMDHMMPEMGGDEALRILRGDPERYARNQHTPVVALTANAKTGLREKYIEEYGFDDYMSKPFHYEELQEMLKRHLPDRAAK